MEKNIQEKSEIIQKRFEGVASSNLHSHIGSNVNENGNILWKNRNCVFQKFKKASGNMALALSVALIISKPIARISFKFWLWVDNRRTDKFPFHSLT